APARLAPVRPGLQPGGGDRQRVRRGAGAASLGAVRRRAGPVRVDPARKRRGPGARAEGGAGGRRPAFRGRRRRGRARGRGVGVAVWLVEYGRDSWFAHTVRFFVDVLTGVPSIVFGLFIYIVLVVGTGSSYAGYKGSFALALLMLPVVIRSTEVIIQLVPAAL